MKHCNKCGIWFEESELEDWGAYKWCPKCAESVRQKYAEVPEETDVIIDKPRNNSDMMYNPSTGNFQITGPNVNYWDWLFGKYGIIRMSMTINHEVIHHVIHKVEKDLRTTYLYDNVYKSIRRIFEMEFA